MDTKGAAFFDLDKTLIEGSSAFHFGRAAYRAGMMTRGQILRDAWENVKFRLNGSTDEGIEALRTRQRELLTEGKASGLELSAMAKALGISRQTAYGWLE